MQRNVEKVVGPWELRETLGVGAWTKVKVAVHSSTGQKAAVKIISKDRLAENWDSTHLAKAAEYGIVD